MGILLVDMSAAFNLVVKEVIVPKLKRLGIGEFAAKLLHSYLTSRKSKTKIKGAYSAWIEVKTGIGEGSVLGPQIFILTIVCCMVVFCRVAASFVAKIKIVDLQTPARPRGAFALKNRFDHYWDTSFYTFLQNKNLMLLFFISIYWG